MLVETLFQDRLPGHELEAQSVLDHGEAPAGEIGDARQPARDILAGLGRAVGQATLGGHLFADSIDLLALQRGDRAPRDGNEPVLRAGMAHFDETRGAPVKRGVHLPAEAGPGKGQVVFRNQLPVEPGRAIAANLPVEVERRQRADAEILWPAGGVIGDASLGDVAGDFPVVGVDALDMPRRGARLPAGAHGSG